MTRRLVAAVVAATLCAASFAVAVTASRTVTTQPVTPTHTTHGDHTCPADGYWATLNPGTDPSCMMPIRVSSPEMLTTAFPGDETSGGAPGAAPFTPVCTGTGTDGFRIVPLYVYDVAVGNKFAEVETDLRTVMMEADRMLYLSAAKQGGGKRLRLATEATATGCRVKFTAVPVDHSYFDGTSGGALFDGLRAAGFFNDTPPAGQLLTTFIDMRYSDRVFGCGFAGMTVDDTPNGAQMNGGYRLNQVFSNCWTPFTTIHEIMHNLGAVQNSAPNSTLAGHCNDGRDVLCYYDNGQNATQNLVCPATVYRSGGLLDCNGDDYFAVNPPAGSYLATHWNTANSPYLITVAKPATAAPALTATLSSDAALVPYVGRSFTGSFTTPGGLLYAGDGVDTYTEADCRVAFNTAPTRGATSGSLTGVLACAGQQGASYVANAGVAVADAIGLDAGTAFGVTVTKPAATLPGALTTSVVTLSDGSFRVTATVTGTLPSGQVVPLVGMRLYAYDNTANTPVLTIPGVPSTGNMYTNALGKVFFNLPSSAAGHAVSVNKVATPGTWDFNGVSFTVTAGTAIGSTPQTITFTAPDTYSLRYSSFVVQASSTSGRTVTISSSTTGICTVSGRTVYLRASGNCVLTANATGSTTYAPASPVTRTVVITPRPTLALTPNYQTARVGATAAFSVTATQVPSNGQVELARRVTTVVNGVKTYTWVVMASVGNGTNTVTLANLPKGTTYVRARLLIGTGVYKTVTVSVYAS